MDSIYTKKNNKMGKIAYAHIVYKDTKQFVTVPITDVKCKKNSESSIKPVDDSDFNKRKVYYVRWSNCGDQCEEDHEHFGYYAAFLMLLGESAEQIQTKINEGRRLIIPNLKDCSESEELQLEAKQKTKRTTSTKDTQTNKNKEILQKYVTRSFLSSRTSFVKNDLEVENEPEHAATIDEKKSVRDENMKLKDELTNSHNQIDELQKTILHLEQKSRIHHLTTITTADRSELHSVKRKLFKKEDLRSDDEDFILHEESARAQGDPEGPKMLSDSRFKPLPKLIALKTANNDVKQRTEYEAEDGQRQNDNSQMMDDNLGEQDISNISRSKGRPKVSTVQRVNSAVKQRIEYEAEDDQRQYDNNEMIKDIPHRPSTSNSNRVKGKPKVMNVQSVNFNVNKRTQYETEDDHRRTENKREADKNNNDDNSDSDGSNDLRAKRRIDPKIKKRKSDRMDPTLTRKILNDIQGALKYYEEQPDVDEYGRKMYDVQSRKIYLGEGVEVSATAWFLIKHGKPTLFFKDMVELIWTQRRLVNRCQNLEKVTTQLINRSPMKELTPEKKRLTYKLFSDYLTEKNLDEEDRIKWLRKVPVLYTEKINYLRRKHYMDDD